MRIEGQAANCTGCFFKGYLASTEPYCRKIGEEIRTIENCPSGPLVQKRPLLGYMKFLLWDSSREDTKAFWKGIGLKR